MRNKYIIKDNIVVIYTKYKNKNIPFIIDIEDFEKINSFENMWDLAVKHNKIEAVKNRIQKQYKRVMFKIQNVILCPNNDEVVDHINGCTLDNRRCNLRICSKKENAQNVHVINSKTGIRNVTIDRNKYRVRINGVSYGVYSNLEDAVRVAEIKRKEHFDIPTPIKDTWYETLIKYQMINEI